jgi:DNA-binding winged helix-turn-helix (wHTH) protein/Tfp pilus assembly protein PilF
MAVPEVYEFGGFMLDVAERRLSNDDGPIPLAPKAFDLLVALARRPGRLVAKQELLDTVWPESYVEEGILTVHVSALRKALGDTSRPARCIETVSRSGYRFIAPIGEYIVTATPSPSPAAVLPARHYALPGAIPTLRGPHSTPEVYELCGRGREHLASASMFEIPKAIAAFRAAAERDPSYAPAFAGLALAHCAQAAMRVAAPSDAYRDAKSAALRALAMDPESADAQVALGTVLFFSEWDWRSAARSLQRALQLNPSHVQGYLMYGRLLDALGQPDAALRMKSKALECDPLSPLVHVQMALSCWNQRRYDDAIAWADKALEINPRHLLAREFLIAAYMNKGDFDRYMAESRTHAESFGVSPDTLMPIVAAYASGGWPGVGRCCLELVDRGSAPAFQLAALSALAGDAEAAFAFLDRAILARDPSLVDLAVAPQWDGVRADPRFDACIERMGLKDYWQSVPSF